ncbi:MAG: ParA family protein [Phycisphaerales bacterium]
MTRTIAFLNQKGGVGKTTTTVNLAAALAERKRSVGLIDLDPQAHLTLHLGVENDERPTVYDLLVDDSVTAEAAMAPVNDRMFLIPAEVDLAAAEQELANAPERNRILARKLESSSLVRKLDFLFIDCPPSLGLLTLNALGAVREVMVPMQAHFLALQGVSRLLETVGMVCQQVNPRLEMTGVILCMYEGQTRLASEVVSDLESFFESQREHAVPWRNCRVLQPPIRRNIKLAEAPSFGASILSYDAECAGAQDYRSLAAALIEDTKLRHADSPRHTESHDREPPEVTVVASGMQDEVETQEVEVIESGAESASS